jgi:outer membrane protein assembly factor BamB
MRPRSRRWLIDEILFLVLLILAPGLSRAADWLQFRGPLGNGVSVETNLPTTLAPGKAVAWQSALTGRGVSSPVVVGDRVFITSSSGPKQEILHILCFNAADGSLRWERRFWATGRTMCQEKTCVAAPTPVSDGRRIFAIFSCNDVFCLDLDGNLLWLRGLTRDYPNASNSIGMSSSPVVVDGVLVVQVENDSESFAAGLDVLTGTNCWKIDRPKRANWTSPVLLRDAEGRTRVALQSSGGIQVIEPATGRVAWSYPEGASTIPSSATDGRVIYAPSFGITGLQAGEDGKAQQLWRSSVLRPGTSSPMVCGTNFFVVNDAGVLTCGDTSAGQRRWQLRLKGPFSSSPVGNAQRLYLVNEKGVLFVVDPNAPEGAVVGELNLGETILATPAISRGAIYLRSDRHLWKLVGP